MTMRSAIGEMVHRHSLLVALGLSAAMLSGCSGSSLPSHRAGTGGTTVAGSTDVIAQGGSAPSSSIGTGGSAGATDVMGSGGSTGRLAGSGGVSVVNTGSGGASIASGGATTSVVASGGMVSGSGGVVTGGIGGVTGMGAVGGGGIGGLGGGSGGTGNAWTDPNCYMRCGQGNAIYYGGAGGRGRRGRWDFHWRQSVGWRHRHPRLDRPRRLLHGDSTRMRVSRSCTPPWSRDGPNYWQMYNASAQLVSGPETLYVFRPTVACQAKAELRPGGNDKRAANLGLFLLTGCGLRWNTRSGPTISFSAQAGQTYYLVVDGFDGDGGGYDLRIDCGGTLSRGRLVSTVSRSMDCLIKQPRNFSPHR